MSAYLSAVLADNPLHYWRLADPGGSMLNDIGSARPLVLVQQILGSGAHAAASQLSYSGPISDGGSAVLVGSCYGVGSGFVFAAPFSLECWVWIFQDQPNVSFFDFEGAGGFSAGLKTDGSNHTQFVQGSGPISTASAALTKNAWHHLVGTNGGGAANLYVDGVSVASAAAGAPSSTTSIGVGGNAVNNSGSPIGAIAEYALYSTGLSGARVAAHYAAADHTTQPPVYSGQGGIVGGVTGALDTGILQQILQSVRRQY